MNTRIHEALAGKQENYILPFFWQHGEDEQTLREYMGVIQDMGIQAVCLESRPHPDFAGPKWWEDMDVILSEARQRNMKVWILDDCHFPTGFANGVMREADASLQKWTVFHLMVDIAGPAEVRVDVDALLSGLGIGFPLSPDSPLSREKELLCAVLYQRKEESSEELCPQYIDVTGSIQNGLLPLSVSEGFYRLFLIYKSANAGIANNFYVNLLQKESVSMLLDAVYEPHYERYKEDFGKTIAGFFSDEPGFYNCIDTLFNFNAIIGREIMPLPWSSELESILLKDDFSYPDLVSLWYATDPKKDSRYRSRYMEAVTRLYEKNFSVQLGDWCRQHGVEYIGHILEDNNSSSRLGPSAGHYFRAMTGQDMSGIDVVTSQILPGRKNLHTTNAALNSKSDGEFYHYALAKLGAGDAHTDVRKQGRAMCEIFGNYGWAEGAQTMKWLADFMLVRGINIFVPHAFSPKAFPDPDCPPHFYAHGINMQSAYLRYLFEYMNRVSHILSNGRSLSSIGILYHAEAEWAGEAMLFQKPGRVCMESQADYDVISADRIMEAELITDKDIPGSLLLRTGSLFLKLLIIPYSQKLPFRLLEKLAQLCRQGFPIIFIDALPTASCEGTDCRDSLDVCSKKALVFTLSELRSYIRSHSLPVFSILSGNEYKDLRAYHYAGDGFECVMLMNEHIAKPVHEVICFQAFQPFAEYDAFENKLCKAELQNNTLMLHLEPGESRIYISETPIAKDGLNPCRNQPSDKTELRESIRLSACFTETQGDFRFITILDKLQDLSMLDNFRSCYQKGFHGVLRYELDFTYHRPAGAPENESLFFDGANEIVTVKLNGKEAGVRLGTPYRFAVGKLLENGRNHLSIENVTTVFPYVKDNPSVNTPLHPMGICGQLWLETY